MHNKQLGWLALFIMVLLLASLACNAAAPAPAPTPSPVSPTATVAATVTVPPTSTPRPTATPNLAATQESQADQARLQKFMESGYISSIDGTILPLSDNSKELAQINYLDYFETGYPDMVSDFAAWVDVKMESAAPVGYPEYSGCGFGFRMKENWDAYTAMVTNDSVLVTWCLEAFGNRCGRIGKTSGKGTVKLPNPAEYQLDFIVQGGTAHALVDGQLIAKYTLFQDRLTEPGYFLYSMISGTNKGYGTRCTMTHGKVWVPDE